MTVAVPATYTNSMVRSHSTRFSRSDLLMLPSPRSQFLTQHIFHSNS
jgi:hypothetical protein